MITAVYEDKIESLMIYVKGASEIVLQQCTKIVGQDGKVRPLDKDEK